MRGLMYYDAHIKGDNHFCSICGHHIENFEAWVYKEGDILLLFCGDTADCRDEFLELNKLQYVGEEEE